MKCLTTGILALSVTVTASAEPAHFAVRESAAGTTATLDQAGGKAVTGRTPGINARRADVAVRAVRSPQASESRCPTGKSVHTRRKRL